MALDEVDYGTCGKCCHLMNGLPNGGETWLGGLAKLSAVEADHRKSFRHGNSDSVGLPQNGGAHALVPGKDSGVFAGSRIPTGKLSGFPSPNDNILLRTVDAPILASRSESR